MNKFAFVAALLFWSTLSAAAVVNVEFKFTPFLGDPKQDKVETVPGKARVYLNNAFVSEQDLTKQEVPVLFEEREIAPSVWVAASALGPMLRKGKNSIRIEFKPVDTKLPYRAQLRWASVTDETREDSVDGQQRSTNQANEGVEDKSATGKIVFEREFVADFAPALPWQAYPPVAALSDADKGAIIALVKARADDFKPDFATLYPLLEGKQGIEVARVKQHKCLDQAYAVGVRVLAPKPEQLDFAITGNAEVVVRRKDADLYRPADPQVFERIKDEDIQMCAGIVLYALYPPRLAVVRSPAGVWEIAY